MQLPYLRENSRTISNWKSYSHHSGKYPHLMRARSFIGPCHPIVKAVCYTFLLSCVEAIFCMTSSIMHWPQC